MADTFSNDLRLRLQESGSNAGTWGDLLNGTITNIASGFGQGSEAIPNASTHTITLADGTADEARSLYLKCTGGGQACTVTLGPNTISKVWIIDNATSYTLTFSQGSGANVAIAAGAVKVIATDGAGSGAAVVDTLDGLEGSLSSLAVTGALTVDTNTLVVDATNNRVGIGTSSVSAPLHLKSSTANAISIQENGSATTGTGQASRFISTTSNVTDVIDSNGYYRIGSSTAPNTGAGFTEIMRLSGGNLLVGTTSAYTGGKLSVNGGIVQPSGAQNVIGVYGTSGLQMIGVTGGDNVIGTMGANEPLVLRTGSAERLRIEADGTLISSKSSGIFFKNSSGGTNSTQIMVSNTGGSMRAGVESSSGGVIQTGTSAYAAVFGNQGNYPTQFTTNGTVRATITSSGNLLVGGTADRGGKICVGGTSSTARILPQTDNVGYIGQSDFRWQAIYAINGTIQTSDEREKTAIKPTTLGLEFIKDLRPISYKWIDGEQQNKGKDEREHQGLIAQQVAETVEKHGIDKNLFGGLDIQKSSKYEDSHGMVYDQLIAPLIKAIQEQQTIIESQAAAITDLTTRLTALENT